MDPRDAVERGHSSRERVAQMASRLSLGGRKIPVTLQSEAAECGLASLSMVAAAHGHRIDLPSLRRRFPPSSRGVSLRELIRCAEGLHLTSRSLRLELSQLSQLRTPCILHWDLNHFVVLAGVRGDRVTIHDPAVGRRVYSMSEISRHFTGIALELTPTAEFKPVVEERKARIQDLWSNLQGLTSSVATVFTLSALLQLLALAGPYYTQLIVDQAIVSQDQGLLVVLALGFGLVLLTRTLISFLRDYTVLYMGNMLSFQMGTNLLSHLVRLPVSYFEKRHLGDVLSRVRSIGPIEELLTTGFIGAVLDGLMGALVLVMMFLYSPLLAWIAIGTGVLFALARIALYRPIKQLREEGIAAAAREETSLLEMMRGIQAVKMLGIESEREAHWQNRCAEAMNAGVRAQRWDLGFKTANDLMFGAENLISVALAAMLVFEGSFTVGMLFSYSMYKTQFTGRLSSLIDWAIRYRMLDVHLMRLADIVHTPEEPGLRGNIETGRPLEGRLELRGVSFRYSDADPMILQDVSLTIDAGSCVCLVGRSGSGKTTLLKILLGLLEPTSGEIWVDGQRLTSSQLRSYRLQVGAVMQDDHFFEGTLAENITTFDSEEDPERLDRACRAAFIADDIAKMPMGLRTWIGNMGAALSGGQRQRILLARAFYREPRVLVLDEGTANLDPDLLRAVTEVLARMKITRVLSTHQHSMLDAADQVFVVEKGRVRQLEARTPAPDPSGGAEETHPARPAPGPETGPRDAAAEA